MFPLHQSGIRAQPLLLRQRHDARSEERSYERKGARGDPEAATQQVDGDAGRYAMLEKEVAGLSKRMDGVEARLGALESKVDAHTVLLNQIGVHTIHPVDTIVVNPAPVTLQQTSRREAVEETLHRDAGCDSSPHLVPPLQLESAATCVNPLITEAVQLVHRQPVHATTSPSSPTIANVNGDGRTDVVVPTVSGTIFVLSGKDGSQVRLFPCRTHGRDNVDGEDDLDLVVTTMNGNVFCFSTSSPDYPLKAWTSINQGRNNVASRYNHEGIYIKPSIKNFPG